MDLSLVIPVYNEEENVAALVAELDRFIQAESGSTEVIAVDDGSIDRSFSLLSDAAKTRSWLKIIRMRRNFGQSSAMAAGFARAGGEVIIPLDADLQNDPADIPALLERIHAGADVVSGWRRDRKDTMVSRKIPSMLANALISRITGVHLHDYGCTLKAYRREVLQKVNLYGEMHRFVPALASQVGAKVEEVVVNHRARVAGVSKYGIDRTLRVVLDLLTVKFLLKYSTRPMQLFGKWAFYLGVAGCGAAAAVLYMKLFGDIKIHRNPLLNLTFFLFLASVQFVAMGMIGELMTRIYHESQGKTVYSVREEVNFDVAQS